MESSTLTADLTVATVLDAWPQTIPLFIDHRMACVGCAMAPFDTLADAATVYGLQLDGFLHELRQAIQKEGPR